MIMKKGTLLIGSCIVVASCIALLIYLKPSEQCDDRCENFKKVCIEGTPCKEYLDEKDITAQEFVDDPKYMQDVLRNIFNDSFNNK